MPMKINGGNTGPIRPNHARDLQGAGDATGRVSKNTPSQIEKLDRVEISDAGRAKSARLEPTAEGTDSRLAEIRARVMRGAYDADEVVGRVAERILDRGDI
jgi:anti-sigma28 factor (negative regulator of flagellin synthesis)